MNLLAHQLRLSALHAEARRLHRFARDAPIGILFVEADGVVQLANDEYLRIVGRSRAEFEGQRFRGARGALPEWLHPERGPRHEAEYVRGDGTRVPVLVGVSRQPEGVAAFVVDLTAEKAAQRAREESEAKYRDIAEKLAESDRRKDEFFNVLAHELRNPLAPIQNALHLLARAPGDLARAARAREVIERQVGHLTRLVEDLLDVARISRGRIQLRRAPMDLAEVVRDAAEDHRAGMEAAGLELTVEVPSAPVPAEGDATRIAQVLGNLLVNSAKFTQSGGAVCVRLTVEPQGTALLHVRDSGEGIAPEVLPRIFEPFSQADRTLARSRGGLGLGLTLVKGLVELHGGTVSVSSPGVGRGTAVSVRLPVAGAIAAAAVPAPAARRRASVLVVEDNRDAAATLREALELEGLSVTVAHDGAAGIAAARRAPPDVIVCDIGLPGALDGYAVARAIREDAALARTPLVALTGYARPEDRERAREAGFDLHFAKPTVVEDLLRGIEGLART
ncbi:MAG TPA: ATP-binding protein [Anaeromyxobacter sp.]|nr:ATP-binding protein [Anaeromyxobacter sp.]